VSLSSRYFKELAIGRNIARSKELKIATTLTKPAYAS
jgi:hypothetical protein